MKKYKKSRTRSIEPRGPRAAALMSATQTNDPIDAILFCVKSLKDELGLGNQPVDVWRVARHLGIKIEESNLDSPGYILCHADRSYEIKVDASMSHERKKFTIAHEIGHFLFFKHVPEVMVGLTVADDDPEEEWLCNLAASELLMPLNNVIRDLNRYKFGWKTVCKISSRYGVTWSAALYRLWRALTAITRVNSQVVIWVLDQNHEFYPERRWPDTHIGSLRWSRRHAVGVAFDDRCMAQSEEAICSGASARPQSIAAWRMGAQDRVLSLIWEPRDSDRIATYFDPELTKAQQEESRRTADESLANLKRMLAEG